MTDNRYLQGVLGMCGSALLFSLMGLLIRYAEGVSFFTTSLFRFTLGACLLISLALFGRIRLQFHNSLLLFLRGLFGGAAVLLFYLSIVKIGLAKGTVISYTYPIFATLGGVLVLKDRVRALVWLLMAAALAGLLLLTRSSWSSGFSGRGDHWIALSFLGSILAGAAVVCVKRLTVSDSSASIFMAQCLVGFWMVLVPANLTAVRLGWELILILVAIGTVATLGQLLMTWSFNHVPIAAGSLLSLLSPIFNVILGVVVFRESMAPVEAVGTALILLACLGMAALGKEPAALRR